MLESLEAICADLAADEDMWAAVRTGTHYVPLLPLLEHDYAEVGAKLAGCLMAAGIPRAEAAELSLSKLVVFALTAEIGRGWALNAVDWIIAGFPVDENVATALEHLAQQKRLPQHTRHQAFAAAKRWRRVQRTAGTSP
jgi:hypothetical protein